MTHWRVTLGVVLLSGFLLTSCVSEAETRPIATDPMTTSTEMSTPNSAAPTPGTTPEVERFEAATRSGETIIGMDVVEGWEYLGPDKVSGGYRLMKAERQDVSEEFDPYESIALLETPATVPASESLAEVLEAHNNDPDVSSVVVVEPTDFGGVEFVGFEAVSNYTLYDIHTQDWYANVGESLVILHLSSIGGGPISTDLFALRDSLTFEPA